MISQMFKRQIACIKVQNQVTICCTKFMIPWKQVFFMIGYVLAFSQENKIVYVELYHINIQEVQKSEVKFCLI